MRFWRPDDHCWEAVLDGDGSPRTAAHLARCAACRTRVAAVRDAGRAARAQAPPLPPGLDDRVLGAVARQAADARRAPRRAGRPRARGRAAAGTAALAAAVLALALVLVLRPAFDGAEAVAVPIVPLTADCSGGATAPATDRDGRPHLVVAGVWAGEEADRFARVLERFERRAGVRITYAYETRNIAAKLRARLKRGCAPDVALLPQPGLLGDLARSGEIQPLTAATQRVVARNYGASWRDLATVDGRLYGVWFKAADKSTFWYRPSALRAAGVDAPPRTWDELLGTARRLAGRGGAPIAVAGASGWTLTDWFENLYLRSAGPLPYQQLAEHRIPWTDPSVRRTLRQLAELFGDPRLVGAPAATANTSFEASVGRVFGPRPSAAMVYEADFVRSFLPPAAQAAGTRGATGAARDVRFFPFPTVRGGRSDSVVVGGDVAVTFSGTPAAQRLMRYLATAPAAEPWARAGGFLSPNRALRASTYPDALTRAAAAALARAAIVRFDLSDLQPPAFGGTAEQGMWGIFQDFLADPRDVDGTARRLEAAARAAWACERAISGSC
jgi:ABC-type glycerol-3-phosphate transport system substrate-binding protein